MCVREREREAEKKPRGREGGYEYERLENRAGKEGKEVENSMTKSSGTEGKKSNETLVISRKGIGNNFHLFRNKLSKSYNPEVVLG